jgi:hypothetical protein
MEPFALSSPFLYTRLRSSLRIPLPTPTFPCSSPHFQLPLVFFVRPLLVIPLLSDLTTLNLQLPRHIQHIPLLYPSSILLPPSHAFFSPLKLQLYMSPFPLRIISLTNNLLPCQFPRPALRVTRTSAKVLNPHRSHYCLV